MKRYCKAALNVFFDEKKINEEKKNYMIVFLWRVKILIL